MRFWQTTAFRVWLVFGTIGLMVSIPLSIYFNSQQREILQDYTKNEFDVLFSRIHSRKGASFI